MNPLLTIITVTRNAGETLGATVRSLEEQTCRLFEWVVIDSVSSDDTLEIARGARIDDKVIVSEPDRGLYDAMNKGLGLAKGDYVMFLNAGDSLHSPDTLQTLADALMDHDYPGIVYGQTDIVDGDRRRMGPRHLTAPATLTLESFSDGMVVCHQAFVVLRKLTGNYDTRYRYSADYDWCIKCLQRSHRNLYVDRVIIDYLCGGMSIRHHRASLWERFRIMAHYYGFVPTVLRHFGFAWRALKRQVFKKKV